MSQPSFSTRLLEVGMGRSLGLVTAPWDRDPRSILILTMPRQGAEILHLHRSPFRLARGAPRVMAMIQRMLCSLTGRVKTLSRADVTSAVGQEEVELRYPRSNNIPWAFTGLTAPRTSPASGGAGGEV